MVEPITMTIRSTARSYLEIIFHRKWLIIVPTVFSTLLTFGYSYTLTPMYRTGAVIEVTERVRENPFIERGASSATPIRGRWRDIISRLKSRSSIEDIVRELNLHEHVRTDQEFRDLVENVRNNVDIRLRDRFLRIDCEYHDPAAAQKIVNVFTREFIKQNLEAQEAETGTGEEYIQREMDIALRRMEEVQEQMRELREQHSDLLPPDATQNIWSELSWIGTDGERKFPPFAPDVLSHLSAAARNFQQFSGRLLELGLELRELESTRAKILEQLEGESEFVVSERVAETNPVVRSLRDQKTRKQVELARLLVDATSNHPSVHRLNTEISNLEKALAAATEVTIREEKTSLNPVYQALQLELSNIDRRIDAVNMRIRLTKTLADDAEKKARQAPDKQREMADLDRRLRRYQDRYWTLTAIAGRIELSRRLEFDERGTQFRIVDDAQLPLRPFKPNKQVYIIGGFFFGLILGGGLVVLAETTDHSFEEPNQLREFLPIPMLGATSRILTPEEQSFINARKRLAILSMMVVGVAVLITIGLIVVFSGRV